MSDLAQRLRPLLGVPSTGPPARDPVNPAMIRHWCDAVGDRNPVYTDPERARHSVHGGLVAPPTMLQAWTMPGLAPPSGGPPAVWREVFRVLDEAGFTSVVATNCRQEYQRYLRPGDVLTSTAIIDEVSEEKQTALGRGHFVSQRVVYRDQQGEVVAQMEFRMLKFAPAEEPAAADAPTRRPRPRPAVNTDTEHFWRGLREGRLLLRACAGCKQLRHPPEAMCHRCQSLDWEDVEASGRGRVYSFAVVHHPQVPPFRYPHVVALVELEEGVRIVAELAGASRDRVRIGMPVAAVFEPADPGDDLVVPRFRPAEGAA